MRPVYVQPANELGTNGAYRGDRQGNKKAGCPEEHPSDTGVTGPTRRWQGWIDEANQTLGGSSQCSAGIFGASWRGYGILPPSTSMSREEPAVARRWDYLIKVDLTNDEVEFWGREGWELVTVVRQEKNDNPEKGWVYYFKKPIEDGR